MVLAPLSIAVALAGDPPPTSPANPPAPKTHVLFMGAEIAVEKDKTFHAVEDVTSTALVIRPGGKAVNVPLAQTVNLQIAESLKLAATTVTVDHLTTERAYTAGADPFQKFEAMASMAAAGQAADADIAQNALMWQSGPGARVVVQPDDNPEVRAEVMTMAANRDARIAQAQASLDQAQAGAQAHSFDVGTLSSEMLKEDAQQMFDAIRLSFEVTPEKDMTNPYFAVIARIREHDSKPGQARKWAYVKSLGAMSAGVPRKVKIYQGGLPPGYILENCEVHLYEGNGELATNLARKRVELTEEETLDYRIIEYVGANKGRTLPAAPAMFVHDLRAALTPAQLNATCQVRVAKDGRVTAAFRDTAGRQPLADPPLESALKALRFKPALEAGKPVESLAPVRLGKIVAP
jgi:hypothetical protein